MAMPVFLFLLTSQDAQPTPQARQFPFLAIIGPESERCLLATPTGIADSLDAEDDEQDTARSDLTTVLGCANPKEFAFHMTLDRLTADWRGALACTLEWLAPSTVSDEDIYHMLPTAHDVFEVGAIGRTRDLAFWAGSPDDSLAPPIEPEAYVDTPVIRKTLRQHLVESMDAEGVTLGKGHTLRAALARIMVGTVLPTDSAHARMAQRRRISEDLKLFARLCAHDEEDIGPIVPVFL